MSEPTFDPGPGWREVHADEATYGKRTVREFDSDGMTEHVWVREEPVPALPTAPATVIRVTSWSGGGKAVAVCMLRLDGTWYDDTIGRDLVNPETITGFEVLAEPRATTAEAVADRFDMLLDDVPGDAIVKQIKREFGVES